MLNTRWIKLVRDIQSSPGRISLMLLSLIVGIFGLSAITSSYQILNREISANYLASKPASATLKIDRIDAALLANLQHVPGIAEINASSTFYADIITAHPRKGAPQTIRLFVSDNFSENNIAKFYPEAGAWPPPPDSILLERESLRQLGLHIGDDITIALANNQRKTLKISGSAHDPSMPTPSTSAFAYITPTSMANLGLGNSLSELKIIVSEKPLDAQHIETVVNRLTLAITAQARRVEKIQIPPPGEHPHQAILRGVLSMLSVFSFLVFILAAVLNASIFEGILAQQIRQMAVMKAVGASTQQIATLYLAFSLMIGVIACAFAIPLGLAAGTALSKLVLLKILNFDLHDRSLPLLTYVQLAGAGIALPLLFTVSGILKSARRPVHATLHDTGTSFTTPATQYRLHFFERFFRDVIAIDNSLIMALRNSFRNRKRLLLSLILLGSAGTLFISSLNIKAASQQHLVTAAQERHYQIEVITKEWQDQSKINALISAVSGVTRVEAWSRSKVTRLSANGVEIEHSYPDDAHGILSMISMPTESQLMDLPLIQGRKLVASDTNAIILNQKALEFYPKAQLGDMLQVRSLGRSSSLQLVGIAQQKMVGAVAFVTPQTAASVLGKGNLSKHYRCVTSSQDDVQIALIANRIEQSLLAQGIPVKAIITETMLRHDVDAHFDLLLLCLLAIAFLMAVVSALGLGATFSSNVLERTREFGIMRSIGATPGRIMRNLIVETACIAAMGYLLALLFSLPASIMLGRFLGNLLMEEAFPLTMTLFPLMLWMVISGLISIIASVLPARRAAKISIREAIVHQ